MPWLVVRYTGLLHSTTTSSFPLALALATLAACADGGKEDRPKSEVTLQYTQHLFSFRTLRGFGAVPLSQNVANTATGTLELFNDSRYRATLSGLTGSDFYALEKTGALTLFISGSSQEPSVAFLGAYGLDGPAEPTDMFFTDRVSTPHSPSIGVFVGTRIVTGQVELGGNWHFVSLHAIFDQSSQVRESVGRAAHGSINIAPDSTPGTWRAISSQGISQNVTAQGSTTVPLSGQIRNELVEGSGDGTCTLQLTYGTDNRGVEAVATGNSTTGRLVIGLDMETTDGEAGLVFMVRKFDTPVGDIRGRFLVGGHTLFVNPANSGSDAFVGVVTLGDSGAFRLDAVGNQGIDFTYVGNYTLTQTAGQTDGGMTISILGTDETWFAAIDRGNDTLVFVDDFLEQRSNGVPELNIGFGVREKPQPQ